MTDTKHTPTPWSCRGIGTCIRNSRGTEIARVNRNVGPEHAPNADFIILACNNHDALVAALDSFVDLWSRWSKYPTFVADPLRQALEMRIDRARALLAKATE